MLGVDGEPHPRSGRPDPETRRGEHRRRETPFTARRVAVFEARRRRSRGRDPSRPLLRRRRAGADHLHRLRRLHDGLPLQREEHARQELPLPGREARRAGIPGDPRRGCRSAGRPSRTAADGYEVRTVNSTALVAQGAAALHLPRRGLRGIGAGHDGPAVPAEGARLAAGDQRLPGQPRAHQCRVADRRARAAAAARTCRRGSRSAPGVYIDEHTHIEAMRYPAGSDAMGLLATLLTGGARAGCAFCSGWRRWPARCCGIPGAPSAACTRLAGRGSR